MKRWMMERWRGLAVTATAVLVSAALVSGGALAQTPPATPTSAAVPGTPAPAAREKAEPKAQAQAAQAAFLSKVAGKLGIGQEQLTTAMKDSAKEMIDEAVKAGRISQEAADRMKQRIDQGGPLFPRGHLGRPAHAGKHGLALGHLRAGLKELADWLGLTPPELGSQLRAGKSLAQVADSQGKSRDQLIAFLTDTFKKHLDEAVAQGKLTQAQADRALQRFTEQVGTLVDRVHQNPGRGNGRPKKADGGA